MRDPKTDPDDARKRRKSALGRGLDALIPGLEPGDEKPPAYFLCDVDRIRPNRYQPRIRFSETELAELADSIREQGVIQPLLVREDSLGYELVAGERRLRAARIAGLVQVPVVVKPVSDAEMLEISIVENIQRADLNPLEEAEAYHRLMAEFSLTQEQVAVKVGKSRSAVANFLRLRQLPEPIKATVADNTLSMGHARALLGTDTTAQMNAAWRQVMDRGLSVRETEALVKRLKAGDRKRPRKPGPDDAYFTDLADELTRHFGTKVSIRRKGERGRVELEFYNQEDLDRLLTLLRTLQAD